MCNQYLRVSLHFISSNSSISNTPFHRSTSVQLALFFRHSISVHLILLQCPAIQLILKQHASHQMVKPITDSLSASSHFQDSSLKAFRSDLQFNITSISTFNYFALPFHYLFICCLFFIAIFTAYFICWALLLFCVLSCSFVYSLPFYHRTLHFEPPFNGSISESSASFQY